MHRKYRFETYINISNKTYKFRITCLIKHTFDVYVNTLQIDIFVSKALPFKHTTMFDGFQQLFHVTRQVYLKYGINNCKI